MNNYLLEIGVEELPSSYIDGALLQMRQLAENILKDNQVNAEEILTYGTPRRLSLILKGVDDFQPDVDLEIKGPSKKIAYDEENNLTKPLIGFIKSQNIKVEDLFIKEFKNEEYVYAKIHKKGESIKEILIKNMPKLITDISFPKNMKWGGKSFKFARPIRWIVSLLNTEVAKFELEGIPVSNITKGHRVLGSSHIEIDDVLNYENLLKENYVILNQEERRNIIKYGSKKLAESLGGEIKDDEDLLEELVYIVEYPTPIVGNIKEKYLSLPLEVITTPMKDHQRYIPVYNSKSKLLPYFITIRNGNKEFADNVVHGNEKVIDARLDDSEFFFKEDISKPLEYYVDSLKKLTFQEKLGTMYDKTLRLIILTKEIGNNLEVSNDTLESLNRAAYLSKADLTTKLVQEFTELQGIMGSIYANLSGETNIVSQAIREQYSPRTSSDALPESTTGSILSIADKLDTIVGMFAIDKEPTGSQDPFGLRRNAIGIINIIENNKWYFSIRKIIELALYIYVDEQSLIFDYDKVKEKIIKFFKARIKNMLIEREIRYDIIDAIIDINDSINNIFNKANKLNEYFKEDRNDFIDAFKRLHNLGIKADEKNIFDEGLLKDKEEFELYEKEKEISLELENLINNNKYIEALNLLGNLVPYINNYFDNVMVLVDDENIKNNRLSMISKIDNIVGNILNIEKIIN